MRTLFLLITFVVPAVVGLAENQPPAAPPSQENVLTGHNRHLYGGIKQILLRSAEKMPEEHFSFRPTEAVRSFGEIVGHVADSQYVFCSMVLGEKSPSLKIEKTKTSKAELVAALNDAFAYCDRAYDGITDLSSMQMVKMMGSDTPKLGVLSVNNVHTIEHYGNLLTYMRMKDIVPPTSDPEFMRQMRKK